MSEILYADKQITLHKDLIVINKYYFPLATSKTIFFSEIQRLALMDSAGVEHRWGLSSKYLNNWFPLDNDRKRKHKFIEFVLKGKKVHPSITPEDPDLVFKLIWENQTPQGKQYVEEMTEKAGKETEIAQQEAMNRENEFKDTQQVLKPITNQTQSIREVLKVEKIEKIECQE